MKKLRFLTLALLITALLPTLASADVSGAGMIVTLAVLPIILVIAVVVIVAAILSRLIKKKNKGSNKEEK